MNKLLQYLTNKPDVNHRALPGLEKFMRGGQPCYECGGSVKRYDVGGFYDCPDQEKDPVTGKCKAEVVRGREAAAANKAANADMNAWAKQVAAMDKEVAKQNAAQAAGQLSFDYDWMQSPVGKADKKAAMAASKQFFQQNPNVFVADDTSGYSPEQKYIIASKLKQRLSTPMGSKLAQEKLGVDPRYYDLQRMQSELAPKMGGWNGMRNFLFNVYKEEGGEYDLPQAQWGSLVNPSTMATMATIAAKAKEFFGFNEPKIIRTPASAPKRLSIRDPRKVMMTTGQPLRPNSDLVTGQYDSEHLGNLLIEAKRRNMSYNDMMNLAAMGFQETKWGRSDDNIGHTKGEFGDEPMQDSYSNFIDAYNAKMKDADRLKIKDEATRLQVYNGLGKIFPSTEAGYHGFNMKKIYGVPVPKGGIDLRKNPLYGKQVIDIRDNVLKRNPEFMRYMDSTYRAPMPKEEFANGGVFNLPKMQMAGQNNLPQRVSINDPRYAELYKNRQVGSFYDDAFSLPDLDEVTVSAPRSYSMKSLRDFTNASLYGAPVNTMKIAAVPQAAMTEGVEMLRGKPYSFSNVNPNLGSFGSNQRDLSMTMGYENPQGFLQNAANVGLSMIDPSIIAGGSALLRQPIQRGARAAGRFLTTKTPLKNTYKINPLAVKEPDVILTRTQKPGQTDELRRLDQFEKKGIHNLNAMERFEYKQMLNSELSRPGYGRGFSSDLGDIGYYSNPNIQDTRGYEGFSEILKTRLPAKEAEKFNVGKNPLQGYISFAPKREYLLPKDLLYSAERFTPTVQGRIGPGTQRDFIMKANAEQKAANIPNWLTGYPSVKEMGGPILDPRGQWSHPGKVTRIPGSDITMQGVPYPVYGVGSNGQEQMMYPDQEYNFVGASYVDEYPMMRNGGGLLSKSVSCSNCGWSWKAVEGGINPLTCHKCGGVVKMKTGGQHGGLDRWFAEKWVDVKTGKACGRQEGEKRAGYPACRPSKRVSSETPKTSSEMSSAEKAKFKSSKTSSQRIDYNHKRNK